jgi:type IV pilus assembly protein PilV
MKIKNDYSTYSEAPMNQWKKEDGFTLIEILIALTIFAVGLLAIAALQTSAISMNSTSNKLTNLSTVAMDQIERLSALPYNDTALNAGTYGPTTSPPTTSPSADYSITYTVTVGVTYGVSLPNIKNIFVTVSGKGKTENFTILKPNVGSL